jgi:hypothetical protein
MMWGRPLAIEKRVDRTQLSRVKPDLIGSEVKSSPNRLNSQELE